MAASAEAAAKPLSMTANDLQTLKQMGVAINYNGYGSAIEDLHFPPDQLYRELVQYPDPLDYVQDAASSWRRLLDGYEADMAHVASLQPERATDKMAVFVLPDAPWAKRVSGVFGNQLANQHPDRAHAVLSLKNADNYTVSVRAPLNKRAGAGEFCSSFPGGGGRAGAGGVNDLPVADFEHFVERFEAAFG